MKKLLMLGLVIVLIGVVVWLSRGVQAPAEISPSPSVSAEITPTASVTPTTSPKATTPVKKTQGVEGTVMLAGKPYQTTVYAFDGAKSDSTAVAQVKTNAAGYFNITLPVGFYIIQAEGGKPWPVCKSWTGMVKAGEFINLSLSCTN